MSAGRQRGGYELDERFFDELFLPDGQPRIRARHLTDHLAGLSSEDLERLQVGVHRRFVHEGITFRVMGEREASEQIIPIDCVPRLITAREWRHIEEGLKQRLRALNLFLQDIYHEGKSLRDGLIPPELVLGNPSYLTPMRGVRVPHDTYVSICGTDVVRTDEGFAVLEDNLRVPSGVSYMLGCREAMKSAMPYVYRRYGVREVADYPAHLYETLASLAQTEVAPRIAVLTPGPANSAYYEHAFLAGEMGVDLVESRDLVVRDARVYARTILGLQRVDVIYRRINAGFLDPVTFMPDSLIGVPGLFHAYRAGNVVIANAPGTGVADDKAVYAYVPRIIRYFLGEEPILANVETRLCREREGLAWTLANLKNLVVKQVGGSGGYGMLVGPHATAEERRDFATHLKSHPENYISQPVLPLSRSACIIDGKLEPRHVDLRPFILQGRHTQYVAPGGLCRVALTKGSLVVNSSQGGGCKDLWVLRA